VLFGARAAALPPLRLLAPAAHQIAQPSILNIPPLPLLPRTQVVVDLVLGDLPASSLPLSQRFSVAWRNSSATSNVALPLSGNPGYLPGHPLLVGLSAWLAQALPSAAWARAARQLRVAAAPARAGQPGPRGRRRRAWHPRTPARAGGR
jgi:hypothetical protein